MSLRDFAELASAPIPFAKVPLGASFLTNPNKKTFFSEKVHPLAIVTLLCYTICNVSAGYGSRGPFNKEAGESPVRARRRNGPIDAPSPRSNRKPIVGQKPLTERC